MIRRFLIWDLKQNKHKITGMEMKYVFITRRTEDVNTITPTDALTAKPRKKYENNLLFLIANSNLRTKVKILRGVTMSSFHRVSSIYYSFYFSFILKCSFGEIENEESR